MVAFGGEPGDAGAVGPHQSGLHGRHLGRVDPRSQFERVLFIAESGHPAGPFADGLAHLIGVLVLSARHAAVVVQDHRQATLAVSISSVCVAFAADLGFVRVLVGDDLLLQRDLAHAGEHPGWARSRLSSSWPMAGPLVISMPVMLRSTRCCCAGSVPPLGGQGEVMVAVVQLLGGVRVILALVGGLVHLRGIPARFERAMPLWSMYRSTGPAS